MLKIFSTKKIRIFIEVTSVLQIQFVIAILIKVIRFNLFTTPEKSPEINIEIGALNSHVNKGAIEFAKFCLNSIPNISEVKEVKTPLNFYDLVIFRTNLKIDSCNKHLFSRSFIANTGNVDSTKQIIKTINSKKVLFVDDGLSNWRRLAEKEPSFLNTYLYKDKGIVKFRAVPINLSFFLSKKKFVYIYSILHLRKSFNILDEYKFFSFWLSELIKPDIEILNDIKQLYIGIWPAFSDRDRDDNIDNQIDFFENSERTNILPNEKIYIKEHPKHKIENFNSENYHYITLSENIASIPIEILLVKMKNLKKIFSYPNTTAYLLKKKIIPLEDSVEIHVIKPKSDEHYAINYNLFYEAL